MYACMHACMYVCVYIYIYIYIYMHVWGIVCMHMCVSCMHLVCLCVCTFHKVQSKCSNTYLPDSNVCMHIFIFACIYLDASV